MINFWVYKMSENRGKCHSFPEPKSKIQRHSIHYHGRLRKQENITYEKVEKENVFFC